MFGLINHALEGFLRETHGDNRWQAIVAATGCGLDRFEPLLPYPADLTEALIAAASDHLGRPRDMLLEDLGIWLVAPRSGGRLRRLLRFGGVGYVDFLASLEELPNRARLALQDIRLPVIRLTERGGGTFRLRLEEPFAGALHVAVGLLRAMADDYGALVMIEVVRGGIGIHLLDASHAKGRRFALAATVP